MKNKLTKEFLEKEYIEKRNSAYKIAEAIECTNGAIYYYLKKYNIKSRSHSEAVKGENNPRYIIGLSCKPNFCVDCDKEISNGKTTEQAKRCSSCANKGKNNPMFGKHRDHSEETRKKMSLSQGGTGIPYEDNIYPYDFFKIRIEILERDNYTCQLCFEYSNEVRHIDYNKENNTKGNLIALCHKCNLIANFNREYWKSYFSSVILALV